MPIQIGGLKVHCLGKVYSMYMCILFDMHNYTCICMYMYNTCTVCVFSGGKRFGAFIIIYTVT